MPLPLGRQIKALRQSKMTQAELAKQAEVSRIFIAKVEAGERLPSMATLERLARVLGARVRIELVAK